MSYSTIDPATGKRFKSYVQFQEANPNSVTNCDGTRLSFNRSFLQAVSIPVASLDREVDFVVGEFRDKVHTFEGYRLLTYREKGFDCVECGKKGHHFAIEKSWAEPKESYHLNLYCEDGTMMTVDHIYPKSKGGPNTVENLQPMCKHCNRKKGSKVTSEIVAHAKEKTVEWEIARQMRIIQKAQGFIKHLCAKHGIDKDSVAAVY